MSNVQSFANSCAYKQMTPNGAVAESAANRGLLALISVQGTTDVLKEQFQTLQDAADNEAYAKQKELGYKAAGELTQGLTQIMGGVLSLGVGLWQGSSLDKTGTAWSSQQTELESQRDSLENLQTQIQQSSKTKAADPVIAVGDAGSTIDNSSVQYRYDDFTKRRDFGEVDSNVLNEWKNDGSKLTQGAGESDESFNKRLTDELNQETIKHIPQDANALDTSLSSLESKIGDLNKKIGALSDKSSTRANNINNIKTGVIEGINATGSVVQSGLTMATAQWSTSQILSQNLATMTQMMMKTLETILQGASQGMDSITNMIVSAAQITASAA